MAEQQKRVEELNARIAALEASRGDIAKTHARFLGEERKLRVEKMLDELLPALAPQLPLLVLDTPGIEPSVASSNAAPESSQATSRGNTKRGGPLTASSATSGRETAKDAKDRLAALAASMHDTPYRSRRTTGTLAARG